MVERALMRDSAALAVQHLLEQRLKPNQVGTVAASNLALCPTAATFDVTGHDAGLETSRKAARRNTGIITGRGFRREIIGQIISAEGENIFATDLQLELALPPRYVLQERVDYIVFEEDNTLRPVILRPTLTHDWKAISQRPKITDEDNMRLLIACRMLEKVYPLNGRTISCAEIIYVCLGGNQHTNGSVKGFPIVWDEMRRQEIVEYVNGWHQRFLAGEDQPVSANPNCADICPFGEICTKSNPNINARQLDLESARHPLFLEDAPVPNLEENYILGSVDSDLGNCPDCYQPIQVTHWIDKDNGGDSVTLARELRCGCESIGEVKKLTVARSKILEVIS